MLHFKLKIRQNSLVGRLHMYPLGELTALPRAPSWIKGEGGEEKEGRMEGSGGREGKAARGVKVKVKEGHTPKERRRGAHLPFIGL